MMGEIAWRHGRPVYFSKIHGEPQTIVPNEVVYQRGGMEVDLKMALRKVLGSTTTFYHVNVVISQTFPERKSVTTRALVVDAVPQPRFTYKERCTELLHSSELLQFIRRVQKDVDACVTKPAGRNVSSFLQDYVTDLILADSFFRLR